MKSLVNSVNSLSDTEKLVLLNKNFSSTELIEILNELYQLDPKQSSEFELFDCCGTGGDKANTFNISTGAAILASSLKIKTCKNGGRSSSSKTGSVDVLEALGVNFSQSLESKLIGLKKYGIAFHSSKAIAQTLAPLKNYARQNKISSFLSLIGPFTNPFILKGQIIGVGREEWFETVEDLAKFSIQNSYCQRIALVQSISPSGQVFDELTSITKARIKIIGKESFDFDFNPEDFKLTKQEEKLLQGGDNHQENADILLKILENKANRCQKETVLINLSLLLTLNESNLNQSNIKDLILSNFQKAKEELESGSSLKNWLDFLKSNQNS